MASFYLFFSFLSVKYVSIPKPLSRVPLLLEHCLSTIITKVTLNKVIVKKKKKKETPPSVNSKLLDIKT